MNDETMIEVREDDDIALPDATTLNATIPVNALVEPKLPPYVGD